MKIIKRKKLWTCSHINRELSILRFLQLGIVSLISLGNQFLQCKSRIQLLEGVRLNLGLIQLRMADSDMDHQYQTSRLSTQQVNLWSNHKLVQVLKLEVFSIKRCGIRRYKEESAKREQWKKWNRSCRTGKMQRVDSRERLEEETNTFTMGLTLVLGHSSERLNLRSNKRIH